MMLLNIFTKYSLVLVAAHIALAWPTPGDMGLMSMDNLFGRDDDFDPDDLSFIKKMAAVGDSYSAGIGAGQLLGGMTDIYCRRYNHSYPYLINEDERLGDPTNRKFQFESCSGAVVDDVVHKQIRSIDSNQQVILLSAGGNDAELVNILNQCVYQFFALQSWQAFAGQLAKLEGQPWAQWLPWEEGARGCGKQLDISRDIIKSRDFADSLDSMLEAAKKKLSTDGMIYYTGYAKFFATDSADCDEVSWSFWVHNLYNFWAEEVYLTKSKREEMNDLVDLMNEKIGDAVERAGEKVTFIDYDPLVSHLGGRFCEKGVDEAAAESNTRASLMFYEFRSSDLLGSSPFKRSVEEDMLTTFGGNINLMAQAVDFVTDGAATYRHEDLVEDVAVEAVANDTVSADNLVNDLFGWIPVEKFLPDGYGRVFHPQVLLHDIIANLVLFQVSNRLYEDNGYEPLDVIGDSATSCRIDSEPDDGEEEEDEEEEPKLDKPDNSENEKHCYNSGQKSSYGKIEAAAESFCKYNLEVHDDGPVFSNFRESAKKTPPGNYHFTVTFEVFEGCEWEYSFDDCMRYFKVPMDSCDCSAKGNKRGGTVRNNCIYARIDPNYGA